MLICPICSENLTTDNKNAVCCNNHSFDIAKEGYLNLLTGNHKSGSLIGDNKDMAKSRRAFLSEGYYDFLADAICDILKSGNYGNMLDISCGEGYYTRYINNATGLNCYGFDISKEMIKQAAKASDNITYFVANMSRIPVKSSSVQAAVHICAPVCESEFSRILADDGIIISAVPGKRHLFGLKEVLYDSPYENNTDITDYKELSLVKSTTVKTEINLKCNDDIINLFKMTPYYYKTSDMDKAKLDNIENLITEAEFIIRIFRKS